MLQAHHQQAVSLAAERALRNGARRCLRRAIQKSNMDSGGIYLLDEPAQAFELVCSQGLGRPFIRAAARYGPETRHWRLLHGARPVFGRFDGLSLPVPEPIRAEGLLALAIIPLTHRRQVIGCLNIASHTIPRVTAAAARRMRAVGQEVADEIIRLWSDKLLEQTEHRYRSLIENLNVGVYRTTLDERGRILQANPALAAMFGFPGVSELMRATPQSLYHRPQDRARLLRTLLAERTVQNYVVRLRRSDGSLFWGAISGRLEDWDKGVSGWFDGILEDVTQHKQAADALSRMHENLLQAREDERRRLAQDLHDSLGQGLVALSLALHGLSDELASDDAPARLDKCVNHCGSLISEVRNISHMLYPPTLESMGLVSALRQLEGMCKDAGFRTLWRLPRGAAGRRLGQEVEIALYRIAQEATANAIRHSGAGQISLSLSLSGPRLRLCVRDDGRGSARKDPLGGLGLRTMQVRSQSIGAAFQAGNVRGGFRVRVELDIKSPRPADASGNGSDRNGSDH